MFLSPWEVLHILQVQQLQAPEGTGLFCARGGGIGQAFAGPLCELFENFEF